MKVVEWVLFSIIFVSFVIVFFGISYIITYFLFNPSVVSQLALMLVSFLSGVLYQVVNHERNS